MRMATPNHRRWTRKPSFTLSDVAVWTFYVLITAASLMALCIVLTLAFPS